MMDLSESVGKSITITLAGRQWTVKIRTLAELGELQAWFKRTIPSPLVRAMEAAEKAKKSKISEAVISLVIDRAQHAELAWPPRIGSWHWLDAVDQSGKQPYVVAFALQPHHPEVNEEAAEKLIEEAAPGEVATLACVLFHGRLPDPKELAPTMGQTMTTSQTPQS